MFECQFIEEQIFIVWEYDCLNKSVWKSDSMTVWVSEYMFDLLCECVHVFKRVSIYVSAIMIVFVSIYVNECVSDWAWI